MTENVLGIEFDPSTWPTPVDAETIEIVKGLMEQAHKKALEGLSYEYSPGHLWENRDGETEVFVQSGVIAPGYVDTYVKKRGSVLRRQVSPYEYYGGSDE